MKLFWQQLLETPLLQWIGVTFGILEVFLAKANKIALYPCGIISILITLFVLWEAGLYAEILLNLYYLIMSVYGWYHWYRRVHEPAVPVAYSDMQQWSIALAIVGIGTPFLYCVLRYHTDSTVPLWDAWVSATAWAGMWLLARRKIENWLFLNVSNAFAIPLLIHKELPMYAVLTAILFIVAILGYFDWKRIIRRQLESKFQ
ncbi:nicotinamide riboside transporter PnuC [Olivibacter sitiensis]|uniref:nicotinamide riboside transporter PnuC n=1 Tax=Olivibacter sitiensis TaxID=376470 RepID=UPI000403FF18|nr:nicotinamide riboside transporter PnuC [Olivibacter sitiensis]